MGIIQDKSNKTFIYNIFFGKSCHPFFFSPFWQKHHKRFFNNFLFTQTYISIFYFFLIQYINI